MSMTWMMPLEAFTSAATTFDSFKKTDPFFADTFSLSPLTVLARFNLEAAFASTLPDTTW